MNNSSSGTAYNIELTTYYNGKEICKNIDTDISTRPAPPNAVKCEWTLAVVESEILFKLDMKWSSDDDKNTYELEVRNSDGNSWIYETEEPFCSHNTRDSDIELEVLLNTLSTNGLKSDNYCQQKIPEIPNLLKSYVKHLREKLANDSNFNNEVNDYKFKAALVQRVSKELVDVQSDKSPKS
jgi:hypothetical protein